MNDRETAEILAQEAEAAEQNEQAEESRPYRRPAPPKNPSQVYSLRIPVERLEQLRLIASKLQSKPTALMRQWVLERLDEESGRRAAFSDPGVGQIIVEIKSDPGDPHINAESLVRQIGDYVLESRPRNEKSRA